MKLSAGRGRLRRKIICTVALLSLSNTIAGAQAQSASESPDPVQYGAVEQEQHTSFRLHRPTAAKTPPQLTQPLESFPSVVNPDLNQSFPFAPGAGMPITPAETRSNTTWRPGVILTGSTGDQELNPTCDLGLAAQQAQQFPQSPEAAFIYAVALTKTSEVAQALKEVRHARNLAQATGDPNYFSRAVGQYEATLAAEPNNECIRYGLGWGYYMQAYLFAERARKEAQTQAILAGQAPRKRSKLNTDLLGGASILASVLTGTRPDASVVPHIPGALENTPGWALPQIKAYYIKSLAALDGVVKHTPQDAWAAVYGAHVREEFDGDHQAALNKLLLLKKAHPDNPAAAFFLADAYARSGNIVAGASSLSQAMKLHMEGK